MLRETTLKINKKKTCAAILSFLMSTFQGVDLKFIDLRISISGDMI